MLLLSGESARLGFPDEEAAMKSIPSCFGLCALCITACCACAQNTVAATPTPSPGMYQLSAVEQGDLYMARRQYVAAIEAYRHAPLLSSVTWVKIGVAYHHLFALDEAMKDYQQALRLDPHNADALNNLGAVYHGKHEYGTAAKYYKKALRYAPRNSALYCNLGVAYFANHKYRDAEKAYGHAFALDPNAFDHDPLATVDTGASREERIAQHYYLARTYARAGQQAQALEYLRKAIDEGFRDKRKLDGEQDFASLRTTLEFKQLMAERILE
jgi:tetratricopeptide (TPR) repeat protein